MKLSRSSVVVLLAFVFLFAFASPTFAALDSPINGASETNPNSGDAAWRAGWGNSWSPQYSLDQPDGTLGFFYKVRREVSVPTTGDPDSSLSWDRTGMMLSHTLDMQSVWNSLTDAERSYVPTASQVIHDPREGYWYLNIRFYDDTQLSNVLHPMRFGLDFTPPRRVENFTSGVSRPTETSHRTFTWTNKEYDDLSGGYWYALYVDDMSPESFVATSLILPWMPGKVTLESLSPGVHKVGIRVEDRATNFGPVAMHTEIIDPDVPFLTMSSPSQGQLLNGARTFSVVSTDSACSPTVTLKIDGITWRTLTRPPYALTVNTKGLSTGHHTFTASARDLFGHIRTVTRDFYVDNMPISITSVSDSPDPFYPVVHDGYKDTTKISFHTGESSSKLQLSIYVGGTLTRTVTWKNAGAGSFSYTWDGKDGAGALPFGTLGAVGPLTADCSYQVQATDRIGNVSATGKLPITIRNYEIVPGSVAGSVKVIAR
jgi:hypothetical protein